MQKKIRVSVIMGGPSSEYEVSINSGEKIFASLDRKKYAPKKIIISKSGKWPMSIKKIAENFDFAFIAMHGEYGEDGTIQKLLEKYKIPFNGSGSRASKMGIDKIASSKAFKKEKLNTPQILKKNIIPPIVIKPQNRGSSVGVTIVKKSSEINKAKKLAKKYSSKIIIEKFIDGKEFACSVLEINKKPASLPVTEIIPQSSHFFDYDAKYTPGASLEITPARINKSLTKQIQNAALKAHKSIQARGYSRSDFIIDKKGKIYILEINTLPGMTKTSLIPKAAKICGISFKQLLDLIIETAIKKS